MSNQGDRQASVRAVTGTAGTYEGDWHALFDSAGIATGNFNGRLLAWINAYLTTSYTELNGAMQAFAAGAGFYNWSSMGTFNASAYDPAAQTLFAAMSVQPNAALKTAYNNLIVSLKAQSLWPKFDALYLMDVHDAQAARLNVVSPGTYNLTAFNSPTFTAKVGYQGNGSTAYLDTNFNPTTAVTPHLVQNSAHISAWHRENATDASAIMGMVASSTDRIYPKFTDNSGYGRANAVSDFSAGVMADASGLFIANRSASNAEQYYRNGTAMTGGVTASVAPGNGDVALLHDTTTFFAGTIVAASIGSSLSATDAANLSTILSTFKTAAEAS